MVQQPLKVRQAEQDDIAYIVDLSRRVQEKLTASGSLQQIGPIPRETVVAQINAGTAHILEGIKAYVASRQPGAIIVLDCWAGNDKLRDFYTRAGFKLHGVFPANGFEVAVFVYGS